MSARVHCLRQCLWLHSLPSRGKSIHSGCPNSLPMNDSHASPPAWTYAFDDCSYVGHRAINSHALDKNINIEPLLTAASSTMTIFEVACSYLKPF